VPDDVLLKAVEVARFAPNQRKETTVKRSGKISDAGAVIVVTWGFLLRVASVCAGWREDAIRGVREGIAELRTAA
jgi:hypothetical protein